PAPSLAPAAPALEIPPTFDWNTLNKDVQNGLEAVVTNPINGPIGTLQAISRLSDSKDSESQAHAKTLAENYEKNLGWYYEALGVNETDITKCSNAVAQILSGKDINAIRYVSAFMHEIAKKIYVGMPADKKSALAKKAFESDFEARFGAKLDAWKAGSLIDKLDFAGLPADAKKTMLDALKEGEGYEGAIMQYLQIKEAQERNGDLALKEKLAKKEKELKEKLKTYNSAALTAYGFGKEFIEYANKSIDGLEPQMLVLALQATMMPLFKLAAKKSALTLGAEKAGVEDYVANRHMGDAYQIRTEA
ncbi:MAG: hypothetical protein AABX75_01355, partial [Nanoarchaeota archaeon]